MTTYNYALTSLTDKRNVSPWAKEQIFINKDCEFSSYVKTVLMLLLIVTMALALGGNSFYCLAIYFKKKLHVKSKVMIVNLAVINIVISLKTPLFECMHVYSYPRWLYGNILNNVHNSFLIFTVVAPFIYSTAISFDRYLAVTKPFRYQAFATKRKFTVVVSITWIYSILWIVILACNFKKVPSNIYTWNVPKTLYHVFHGIHIIIPIVVIPFVYTQIVLTVRNSGANAGMKHVISRDITLAKKSALVISVLFLLWVPAVILDLIYNIYPKNCISKQLGLVSIWLVSCVNCAVNPVIYSYGNKAITKHIKKILQICKLCCKTCKRGNDCDSVNNNMTIKSGQLLTL